MSYRRNRPRPVYLRRTRPNVVPVAVEELAEPEDTAAKAADFQREGHTPRGAVAETL